MQWKYKRKISGTAADREHQAGNNNLSVRLLREQRVWDLLGKPDKLVLARLTQLA